MLLLAGLFTSSAAAQQPAAAAHDTAELAKQLSNPIASLVSVPFQFNWEQNVGPSDLTRFILNVQPVMPFTVNKDVTLIVRLIAPLISQPPLTDGGVAASGIGDLTTSFFVVVSIESPHGLRTIVAVGARDRPPDVRAAGRRRRAAAG